MQLNKAMVGFLTHSGYAHGGNGYEGVAFLLEQFKDSGLADPGDPKHGLDLDALAARYVEQYAQYKSAKKTERQPRHPEGAGREPPGVQGQAGQPRSARSLHPRQAGRSAARHNVFHDYYQALVQALFDAGVSRTVYCVNIDAVIAALLLKMVWKPYREGTFSAEALEAAAFTIFLYARMIGCAAEIDDHLNRGRNMDTRTAASQCRFVA